ncbi:exodeoxyribonuclease VII large subunit [Candidatus Saccharibacteria bacterium]|nr:exodeoxyribonuclease VII large subunit [Candidatus Saccharibacteria bacterium]
METEVLTVSEFNAILNQTLQFAYPEIMIEGEVASFKISQKKWVFFDLKDDDSVISCFMPIFQLKTKVEDGMLVKIRCAPRLTKWGKFSLTVKSLELSGEGAVKKAFELLKAEFTREGLFAIERKRALPSHPRRIGLITSRQAAAFNDFVTILDDRWAGLEVIHAQVQVQGAEAPDQIARAIEYFSARSAKFDVLVIIRGGGSAEDLQAFNTESVVRAVFGSKVPTLIAIGHEDDVSLAELAADLRAATPSDAARRLVPDKNAVIDTLTDSVYVMSHQIISKIEQCFYGIDKFELAFRNNFIEISQTVEQKINKLQTALENILAEKEFKLASICRLLQSLDPKAILARGYSIATVGSHVVHSADQVSATDTIVLQLHQGKVSLRRTNKQLKGERRNDEHKKRHRGKL